MFNDNLSNYDCSVYNWKYNTNTNTATQYDDSDNLFSNIQDSIWNIDDDTAKQYLHKSNEDLSLQPDGFSINNIFLKNETKNSTSILDQVKNILKNNGTITVDFNKCKFDDSNYTGDYKTDPMGTLKAGQKYTVAYNSQTGFTTTGFNQDTNSSINRTYNNGSLNDNQISLWGRVYTLKQDSNGNASVIDPTYGEVGVIELNK